MDDAERDLRQPLVSVSIGCAAVFLMGGPTKGTPPSALLLRSGDAVVLSGPARLCYHGLPRVLTDQPPGEALRCCSTCGGDASGDGNGCADPAFAPFARHMLGCRINISIRDTVSR